MKNELVELVKRLNEELYPDCEEPRWGEVRYETNYWCESISIAGHCLWNYNHPGEDGKTVERRRAMALLSLDQEEPEVIITTYNPWRLYRAIQSHLVMASIVMADWYLNDLLATHAAEGTLALYLTAN